MDSGYQLLDSGEGRKLERFGAYVLDRPALAAVWKKGNPSLWDSADAVLTREGKCSSWSTSLPPWSVEVEGIEFHLELTDFGHVGLFLEHAKFWPWIEQRGGDVLNLFAYTGGASLAAAKGGGTVCHVDASKGIVDWAKKNGALNACSTIRWIVDDVLKFLTKEARRGKSYSGIILDPPSFGRGPKGEVFKLEEKAHTLLILCQKLLRKGGYLLFSCHTLGWTPQVLSRLMLDYFPEATWETGEMLIGDQLPSGAYALGVRQ